MTIGHVVAADEVSVASLVRRAAAGDGGAWESLVDRYAKLIWAITRDCKVIDSDAVGVRAGDVDAAARAHQPA